MKHDMIGPSYKPTGGKFLGKEREKKKQLS